jgi:hypothetical protein
MRIGVLAGNLPFIRANNKVNFNSLSGIIAGVILTIAGIIVLIGPTNTTRSNMTSTPTNSTSVGGSDCKRGVNAGRTEAGTDFNSQIKYNKNGHNYSSEGQAFFSCYNPAYDQEYARLQFGHQQNSSSSVIPSSQQQNTTCDKVGYASCYSMGYSAGKSSYYSSESFGCLPPIVLNSTQNHNYCLGYHTAPSQAI